MIGGDPKSSGYSQSLRFLLMSSSRRDFLKVLGGSALALPALSISSLPALAQDATERPLRYCIVGLGRISLDEFMPGVRLSHKARLTALVSANRAKAEKVAAQYQIDPKNIYSYETLNRIADNPEIDAVYIALPNGMHAEYTVRAAEAGKHVLCEKPMANTPAECEQMIAACRKAGKKLMIAYRCRLEPTNLRAISLIRSGALGKVQIIQSSDGFNISPTYTIMGETRPEWRLDKAMAGGGPMMDVGIYSLQATRYLSGEEPAEISATWSTSKGDSRFHGIEENLVWHTKFPSGVLATCNTSYGSNIGDSARVDGSKGWLELNPGFFYDGLRLRGHSQTQGNLDFVADNPNPRQFTTEADYFVDCVRQNREPKINGEEGLRDLKLIAAIYKSCREGGQPQQV